MVGETERKGLEKRRECGRRRPGRGRHDIPKRDGERGGRELERRAENERERINATPRPGAREKNYHNIGIVSTYYKGEKNERMKNESRKNSTAFDLRGYRSTAKCKQETQASKRTHLKHGTMKRIHTACTY